MGQCKVLAVRDVLAGRPRINEGKLRRDNSPIFQADGYRALSDHFTDQHRVQLFCLLRTQPKINLTIATLLDCFNDATMFLIAC